QAPDVPADKGDGRQDDPEIPAHLLDQHLAELAPDEVEVGAEVDAEQDHRDGGDHLDVGGVAGHAVVFDAKAAGACRAEGDQQAVHQGAAPRQHKNDLDDGHAQIDGVEDGGGLADGGHHFFHLGAGAFGFHQVDMAAAGQRQHRQQKDQDAHAPDPVGEAAPEQDAHGQA